MTQYNLVSQNSESTVVSEYKPDNVRQSAYQSEAELEKAFIRQLEQQAYEYVTIHSEADLISNLRKQLEKLNNYKFTDAEWEDFFRTYLANGAEGIVEKTKTIQEDYKKILKRPDGSFETIKLIDKKNIHNNTLQVINQYATEDGKHSNRYDVTVLVNGLPLVHIELKRRGVNIKEAFNQINRYQNESFWSGCGLFEFVQIFVISNGTYTKYYSNTTRNAHIKEAGSDSKNSKKTSNSFEFTSWWADAANKPITDLMDFAKTFFQKHTILNILTKYCVFTVDQLLLVMRPYQIVATERIINKIQIASNYKQWGSVEGGGYIWHTTGSGKTLTSFKTAQLAAKMPGIDKVLFVVDRKDLDYQTMKEYDKFEKGAANSNTNTAILTKQLNDETEATNIIITTIQKLTCFIKQNPGHKIYNKHVVMIFDECHRSQFGDMHELITKNFKKYHMFGFTGTPIFTVNASANGKITLKTTEQAFGKPLHTYTIVNAIADKNVLPFRIDYITTIKPKANIKDGKVYNIAKSPAFMDPKRIENITSYILEHFNQKTMRNDKSYSFSTIQNVEEVASAKDRLKIEEIKNRIRLTGFNSIFAVESIDMAKAYYEEFKKQMAELTPDKRLKIATIYSFGVNDDSNSDTGNLEEEDSDDTSKLDASSREFLDAAINDYNEMFKTNYDTSSDKFQNYYKDVSLRMKNREIDLLIVVNMFLTGFDATTLNTLWVDKNLRLHGLLQAFSRTNRILNSIKTFGNIVCFRNLEEETNKSLALFGDKEAGGVVLLKTYEEYYNGYVDNKGNNVPGYKDLIAELKQYPVGEMIISETAQKAFVKLYGSVLRVRNILSVFDEFAGNEIISDRDLQDYQSEYIRIYEELRNKRKQDDTNINDDLVFEMELVKQVEVNIDYILMLIKKYHQGNMKDKEIVINIGKSIDSSMELRNKKELIMKFIESLTPTSDIDKDWEAYVDSAKKTELDKIIAEENLNKTEAYSFVNSAFRDGYVTTTGIAITKVIPPVPLFTKDNARSNLIQRVLDKITAFFEKFRTISVKPMEE